MLLRITIILFLLAGNVQLILAGFTGSLSGRLIDTDTKQALPGAIIRIVDTKITTVADKNGFYKISSVPPGNYIIRAKMVGYAVTVVKNVIIQADYNTELNIEMDSEVLKLGREIVVTAERPLIHENVTASNYTLDYGMVNEQFPIDHFYQTLKMQPGIVNGHIRGGRNYDTHYLVDGLSIQDPMFREINALVPSSAISDMSIQPGGFDAEYGEAISGIVNLTTKEGKEKTEGLFKFYTDDIGLNVKNDNLRRMELSVGGPLLVSFGGPIYDFNYFISGNMNFENNSNVYDKSNENPELSGGQNYHYTTKFTFKLLQRIKVIFQSLSSSWQARQFSNYLFTVTDTNDAEQKKECNRLNLTLIHTLNPQSFYTVTFGKDMVNKRVLDKISISDETDALISNASGEVYDWEDFVKVNTYFLKSSYWHQLSQNNLIKLGIQFKSYDINMNSLLLYEAPDEDDDRIGTLEAQFDHLKVRPAMMAVYAQNRINYEKFVANIGLRADYFNPNITYIQNSSRTSEDAESASMRAAKAKFQLSPRFGASMPFFFKEDRLHVNYGWFFQMPPLYYFYLNTSRNSDVTYPLFGNPELEAERTHALEIGYRKGLGPKTLWGATFFWKKTSNLVNTQAYYSGEDDPLNYSLFENLDKAKIRGAEIFIERRPGNNRIYGKLSYTYCKAEGTGSFPRENYQAFVHDLISSTRNAYYPLAWDQRHKFSLNVNYITRNSFRASFLARVNSPLPIFDEEFHIQRRGDWRNYIDMRISKKIPFFLGEISPYFEMLNILDDREKNLSLNTYSMSNYFMLPEMDNYIYESGRRVRLGLMIFF